MSDTENKKGLIEVIEDLMDKNLQEKAAKAAEADMTKKDEIENPLAELLMQGDLASANLTTVSYYKTKQEVKFSIKE